MSKKHELHIVVPGLCGPLSETTSLQQDDSIKRWVAYLSKAERRPLSGDFYAVIAALTSMKIEQDFPAAAITNHANSVTNKKYMMFADPVHLRADLDHAVLTSLDDALVEQEELSQLFESLQQHFVDDDFELNCLPSGQWFIATDKKIVMQTTPLADSIGRNVNFILPQGDDAPYWKKMLTEAQMIMHSHEINESRENRGLQAVNSLWFHGVGALPEYGEGADMQVFSNTPLIEGLAKLLQSPFASLPTSIENFNAELSDSTLNQTLVYYSDVQSLVNYSDTRLWRQKHKELLLKQLYPMIDSLKKQQVDIYLYPCDGNVYNFSRFDFLKLWRNKDLDNYVSHY